MSSQQFFDAIESSALRDVAAHWNEVRGVRAMPAWQDIKPGAIGRYLGIIWSWKYDPIADEFTGRLAGERIQTAFGANLRGAKMRDVFEGRDYNQMFLRHKRVVTAPALFLGKGLVFRHLHRFDIGERIILPVSDNELTADGIFGATDFKTHNGTIPEDIKQRGEVESWFTL